MARHLVKWKIYKIYVLWHCYVLPVIIKESGKQIILLYSRAIVVRDILPNIVTMNVFFMNWVPHTRYILLETWTRWSVASTSPRRILLVYGFMESPVPRIKYYTVLITILHRTHWLCTGHGDYCINGTIMESISDILYSKKVWNKM